MADRSYYKFLYCTFPLFLNSIFNFYYSELNRITFGIP